MVGRRALHDVFPGSDEASTLARSMDWSATGLGAVEGWSSGFRTVVRLCMRSSFAMNVLAGPDLVQIYNQAYAALIGGKHPRALGAPVRVAWGEVWDELRPVFEAVVEEDEARWFEDRRLLLRRNGFPEESYVTFCYAPLDRDGCAPGGIVATVYETTRRVRDERRARALHRVAAHAAGAESLDDALSGCLSALECAAADVPFAAAWTAGGDARAARLVASTGAAPGSPPAPATIALDDGGDAGAWPLPRAARTGEPAWFELEGAARRGVVFPLVGPDEGRARAFLGVALSSEIAFDDEYRGFVDRVAEAFSRAASAGAAREHARREGDSQRSRTLEELARSLADEARVLVGAREAVVAFEGRAAPDAAIRVVSRAPGAAPPRAHRRRVALSGVRGDPLGTIEVATPEGQVGEEAAARLRPFAERAAVVVEGFLLVPRAGAGDRDVRSLAFALASTESVERRRLARDLHDSVGQTLSLAKLELDRASGERGAQVPRALHDRLDEAVRQVRELTFELHPHVLETSGLGEALRSYVATWSQRTGLSALLRENGDPVDLPIPVLQITFRAVKELLANVAKHARAKEAVVVVHWGPSGVRVVVDDDGVGFDARRPPASDEQGLGLFSIRERVVALGGRFEVESLPGQGTRALLELRA